MHEKNFTQRKQRTIGGVIGWRLLAIERGFPEPLRVDMQPIGKRVKSFERRVVAAKIHQIHRNGGCAARFRTHRHNGEIIPVETTVLIRNAKADNDTDRVGCELWCGPRLAVMVNFEIIIGGQTLQSGANAFSSGLMQNGL